METNALDLARVRSVEKLSERNNTMKTKVERGYYHNVRSDNGCTVTQIKPNGKTIVDEIPAGETTAVFAFTSEFDVSDDTADVQQVFKLAPQQQLTLLGVLGGDKLPAGYTRLAYLKGYGHQFINTGVYPDVSIGCCIETGPSQHIVYALLAGAASGSSGFIPLSNYVNCTIGFADKISNHYPQRDGSSASSGATAIENGYKASGRIRVALNYMCSGRWDYEDDKNNVSRGVELAYIGLQIYLFARNYDNMKPGDNYFYGWDAPIYSARFSKDKSLIMDFVPALDEKGTPCMFDLVNRQSFYNQGPGAFIAGVETQTQLNNMLRKLPDRSGQDVGTLQVRLADALQTPENEARLDAMLAKNWEISQAA